MQVLNAAWDVCIPVVSENALLTHDRESYNKILENAKPLNDPDGRHFSSFTYLRLSPLLMERHNFLEFERFVKRMHGKTLNTLFILFPFKFFTNHYMSMDFLRCCLCACLVRRELITQSIDFPNPRRQNPCLWLVDCPVCLPDIRYHKLLNLHIGSIARPLKRDTMWPCRNTPSLTTYKTQGLYSPILNREVCINFMKS